MRPIIPFRLLALTLTLGFVFSCGLSACGIKGGLYIPPPIQTPPDHSKDAPVNQSAPKAP